MRSPVQSATWQFPLLGGTALPKDRDEHPDSFTIPTGSITLYPVRRGSSMHYFSYRPDGDGVKYHLSPRAGGAQKSIQLDAADTEKALIEGLMSHLPGRANAMTMFSRIMALPEHLHAQAVEYIAQQKPIGCYTASEDLRNALNSMLTTMGPAQVKSMAVSQMVFEMTRTPHERRGELSADYRKRYPEPWVDEAKKKVAEAGRAPRPKPATVETEFNFGFN